MIRGNDLFELISNRRDDGFAFCGKCYAHEEHAISDMDNTPFGAHGGSRTPLRPQVLRNSAGYPVNLLLFDIPRQIFR